MDNIIKFHTKDFLNKGALKSINGFKAENQGKVPVMEIFKTYEGEGSKIGTPRILVRLGGCPVRCVNCDTPHSFTVKKSMKVYSPAELVQEIVKVARYDENHFSVREISITGGEPMMYPEEVKQIAIGLHALGFKTSIETSGTIIDQEVFTYFDYVSLDIKLPSTGVMFTKEQIATIYAMKCQHPGTQVKVVVSNEEDLQWVLDNLYDFINPLSKSSPLIITPNSPFIKNGKQEDSVYADLMNMVVEWNRGYNVAVIPQIHKLLGFE